MSGRKARGLDRMRGSDGTLAAKKSYALTEDMTDDELFWRDWPRWQSRKRWRAILREADDGLHVSKTVLQGLVRKWGVPAFAGEYVAARWSGEIAPAGRPVAPVQVSYGPEIPEWANEHHRERFEAVACVRHCHKVYKEFETSTPPRPGNEPRLKHHPDRDTWTIRAPKREALERVAGRLGVASSTLKSWEADMRRWRRRVLGQTD